MVVFLYWFPLRTYFYQVGQTIMITKTTDDNIYILYNYTKISLQFININFTFAYSNFQDFPGCQCWSKINSTNFYQMTFEFVAKYLTV